MVHAACWAHSRRKVFDALKLSPQDRVAAQLVARIDELFAVDAEAAKLAVLPASALGKAASYTLSLWDKLTKFLEHPELELSNNSAENSMRPVVVGRKNWIHVGSEKAGPKVAAILSVVETCRRLKSPLRDYLAGVLPGLGNVSMQRVGQYTPAAWAASQSSKVKTGDAI